MVKPRTQEPDHLWATNPMVRELNGTETLYEENRAAAAAPTVNQPIVDVLPGMDVCHQCRQCSRVFTSIRGLNVHRRSKHPLEYHEENVPVRGPKVRWDHEELVLLAREKIRLRELGSRNMNQLLHAVFPHRTIESIKGVRRKNNRKYQDIVQALTAELSVETAHCAERSMSRRLCPGIVSMITCSEQAAWYGSQQME